ncbi:MAG: translation initiation factor IF-2 [Candidatus Hydrothermarchaeales archaeon]
MIRQPIVSVLGHIDHGKTTLLDAIRGTTVADSEAGRITQHIGATEVPLGTIEDISGKLLEKLKFKIKVPGLLFIDTPGHEAFTTLRKRGGALSDLAVLVIDINEGFQPQTLEALNILKGYKTPFLVVANKVDKIHGWISHPGYSFTKSITLQNEDVISLIDTKTYELVGVLHEEGFQSERFDRIQKFEEQISIIPTSAKTGEGIPELLMVLVGLAQRFLEKQLEVEEKGPAKGTILEVKEERGLGVTIDVVVYDGEIKRGDTIVVGALDGVIVTKVRALLKPKPLDEIRDPRYRFDSVKEASAACGVKISAPHLQDALSGAPLRTVEDGIEEAKSEILEEIEEVRIETDEMGVVIKADTLGSLEALVKMSNQEGIPIRRADIGKVSKRDVIEAKSVMDSDFFGAAILAFNTGVLKDAEAKAADLGVTIFQDDVIYRLMEDHQEWVEEAKERKKKEEFEALVKPGKIKILPGYIFRHSKPAIVGVEVILGTIKAKYKLMKGEGMVIGTIKAIQEKNKNIEKATRGDQVALSIEGPVVGRQINENDILYTDIPEGDATLYETKYRDFLTSDEGEAYEEIKLIKRKAKPLWAVGIGGK